MNLFCLICYSALEKIILNGYLALGLMYFFTVGEDEVKAWTVQVGFVMSVCVISTLLCARVLPHLYVCHVICEYFIAVAQMCCAAVS